MIFETERLILRHWQPEDAAALFKYAKNPNVGPIAGWPIHTSVENSRFIIDNVLSVEETYAVVLRESGEPVGSIGLMIGEKSYLHLKADEAEIGFWIGEPYWGKGLIPEAVEKLLEYAFLTLGFSVVWCGYFEGNAKSARVQEKCGFTYHHTEYGVEWKPISARLNENITMQTKVQWLECVSNKIECPAR